jgi:hypothetical protein
MAVVRAHGVAVDVPPGWEGQLRRCEDDPAAHADRARRRAMAPEALAAAAEVAGEPLDDPDRPRVVVHVANVPLPVDRGDFGGGVVEQLGFRNAFVALLEYDASGAGRGLFARRGIPRRLRAADFEPNALQRPLPGQAGVQRFFTEGDRCFCLYVVLGSARMAGVLVPAVNDVLATLTVDG